MTAWNYAASRYFDERDNDVKKLIRKEVNHLADCLICINNIRYDVGISLLE